MQRAGYQGIRGGYEAKGITPQLIWHGTSSEVIPQILSHGFAVTPRAVNGRAMGHGVYFSPLHMAMQSLGFSPSDQNGE